MDASSEHLRGIFLFKPHSLSLAIVNVALFLSRIPFFLSFIPEDIPAYMFEFYLRLGVEHITDLEGYDHMLFLLALCAIYTLRDWKTLLVLVTAFTIGHSLTLALAALQIITFPSNIIEFLIPVTIFLTAIFNLFSFGKKSGYRLRYVVALLFGLVHGLGFSNYFRAILGREAEIVLPLLSFNLGVELGQIVIVLIVLAMSSVALMVLKIKRRWWVAMLSLVAAAISLYLMWDTFPWQV